MLRRHRKMPLAEINIVPYVDVMLVLLVIFMITAPLLKTGVTVQLPKAQAKPLASKDRSLPLIVTIDAKGQYYLSTAANPKAALTRKVLLSQLSASMKEDEKRSVLLRGDKEVDYGKVVSLMAMLQALGITQVGLITDNITVT